MPELPEVESIRRSLVPRLLGRTIVGATLLRRDILIAPGDPPGGFPRQRASSRKRPAPITPADLLQGATITDLIRRGKQLAVIAAHSDRALVVQLGMTGHLEFFPGAPTLPRPHVHAHWSLDSAAAVHFHDPRRFGALRLFRSVAALYEHWSALGPDALTITPDQLHGALANANRPIKAALLDQAVLAGVGNIYADESLHLAGINPRIRARRLRSAQLESLAAAIRAVLTQAVAAGGSTLRDYADSDGRPGSFQTRHAVYGRAGEPCRVCARPLASALLAQRTTVWCRDCQPARNRGIR